MRGNITRMGAAPADGAGRVEQRGADEPAYEAGKEWIRRILVRVSHGLEVVRRIWGAASYGPDFRARRRAPSGLSPDRKDWDTDR